MLGVPLRAHKADIRSGNRNLNHTQPTDSQTASPSLPANPDINVTSAANFEGSIDKLYYVELVKNSSTIPANMPDLAELINKLDAMYSVSYGDINGIAQPTLL